MVVSSSRKRRARVEGLDVRWQVVVRRARALKEWRVRLLRVL